MASEGAAPDYTLRVKEYFPKAKDFDRDEAGRPILDSLRGPARIEARQQIARERIIAGAELKLLQEKLRMCYHKEGVNHYELCKDIATAYLERLRAPGNGALKASFA